MKNVLKKSDLTELIERTELLQKNSKSLWGKMSSHEMLCHTADQIKLAVGGITSKYQGNLLTTTILKKLILLGVPAPKGKVETTKELKQGAGGTKPIEFEADRKTLISLLRLFDTNFKKGNKIQHPAFGMMNKKEWGRLVYVHMDHHLKQFGK
ncbi:MAG: DUF1569 domain-containing protein [Bacteroidetes bacterium]|nr:DUF1569 domain-containing protein [Bacteroidota bacterium]